MKESEVKTARRYDSPLRKEEITKIVYSGKKGSWDELRGKIREGYPNPPEYDVFFGDIHGHSNFSDGLCDSDSYYLTARDKAGLDFCALTDHDHGGVGSDELWDGKWEIIQKNAERYNDPGKFVTIPAYERDSYPWYNNMVVYFSGTKNRMLRGIGDGEITREELKDFLKRDDVILVPHTVSSVESGTDFKALPLELMPTLIEICSKWGTCEYMGNPNPGYVQAEGGFWVDALEKGAVAGCIASSDDHSGNPGMPSEADLSQDRRKGPFLTGVLAKKLSRDNVFNALKSRRCYALEGSRIQIDFRINGHVMGSEIAASNRFVYWKIKAEKPIESITLVKNGRDYIIYTARTKSVEDENMVYDYKVERNKDYYYLRIFQQDKSRAWTSPIWVEKV